MSWLEGIEEWQRQNNESLVRDSGASPGWVMPVDPVAELARQQQIESANNAQWGIGAVAAPAPPAPAATGAATTSGGLTTDQKSAKAIIEAFLGEWGLGALAGRMWDQYLQVPSMDLIKLELKKQPEYAARFPGMAALAKAGHSMDEATYIGLERQYAEEAHAAGLPSSFYDDPSDYGKLIANRVSPRQFRERVQLAAAAASSADATVRGELERMYGITAGELTAYFIDPDKALPLLQQRYGAARLSAVATRSGFGGLSATEAEGIGGVLSEDKAAGAFGELAANRELFASNLGRDEALGRGDQLAAITGSHPAQDRIRRKRERRVAEFEGGGQFATDRGGVAGLGVA